LAQVSRDFVASVINLFIDMFGEASVQLLPDSCRIKIDSCERVVPPLEFGPASDACTPRDIGKRMAQIPTGVFCPVSGTYGSVFEDNIMVGAEM